MIVIDILTINNELIEVNLSIGETVTHSQYGGITIVSIDKHNYAYIRTHAGYREHIPLSDIVNDIANNPYYY